MRRRLERGRFIFSMPRSIIMGIDPGDSSVKAVVLERGERDVPPKVLAMVKKPSLGFKQGYIVDLDDAGESIESLVKEVERASGVRARRALVAVGGIPLAGAVLESSIAVSRADSVITEDDVSRAIDAARERLPGAANRTVLAEFPVGFKLDRERVLANPVGMSGQKLEARVHFLSYLSRHLDDLEDLFESRGFTLRDGDFVPSPIVSSFVSVTKQQRAAGCVLADIGSDTTHVAVFEDGSLISAAVLPVGSKAITNDIALGLRVSLEDAEELKRGGEKSGPAKKKIDDIIEARLSDIFELIERHLEKLGRNGLLPAGIVLTGGGALIPGVDELARHQLRLPARVTRTLFPVNVPMRQDDPRASRLAVSDPTFAVAYGLACYGLDPRNTRDSFGFSVLSRDVTNSLRSFLRHFLP